MADDHNPMIYLQFAKIFKSEEDMETYKRKTFAKLRKETTAEILDATPITPAPIAPPADDKFYNLPTSTASNFIIESLGAGGNIADLPARKKKVDHGTHYEVQKNGNIIRVIMTSPKAELTIELPNMDNLGSNTPTKSFFNLVLGKVNERAMFDGRLARDELSFPLQELVDIGLYQTPQSARKGFYASMDVLTSIKLKGKIRETKKKIRSFPRLEVIFIGAYIERGQCVVRLNNAIDWRFLIRYFTIIPKYFYSLTNRSNDLVYYISYLARQNTKEIAERGYFTISFRAIQCKLNLPSEKTTKNPKRDIQDAIENAIVEIETAHFNQYKNMDLQLLPCYDEDASIKEYLDNGYLKVTLAGDFADYFIHLNENAVKRIEQAKKRQAKIAEKAMATNMAKALEAGENKTD